MDIFWLIPVGLVAGVFVWGFYFLTAVRHGHGGRVDGKILTDRPAPKK